MAGTTEKSLPFLTHTSMLMPLLTQGTHEGAASTGPKTLGETSTTSLLGLSLPGPGPLPEGPGAQTSAGYPLSGSPTPFLGPLPLVLQSGTTEGCTDKAQLRSTATGGGLHRLSQLLSGESARAESRVLGQGQTPGPGWGMDHGGVGQHTRNGGPGQGHIPKPHPHAR